MKTNNRYKRNVLLVLIAILSVILSVYSYRIFMAARPNGSDKELDKLVRSIRDLSTDNKPEKFYEGAKINIDDLEQGCPTRDCIPSIDEPKFETVSKASWMNSDDVVFAIEFDGIKKAYPQKIMNWHEIVNDDFNKTPIAITFCPLCGSAVAFERVVNGKVAEFGVSGKLHNNDLVMYDRNEENYWQQITGEAIIGPAAKRNEFLKPISIVTTTWSKWKNTHPDTLILSIDTGFSRDYNKYPYGTYEKDGRILFGLENENTALHPKEVVYGIVVNNEAKAYELTKIESEQVVSDTVGGIHIRGEITNDGTITFTNLVSGEEIVATRLFWFAWAAFNPDTKLYK